MYLTNNVGLSKKFIIFLVNILIALQQLFKKFNVIDDVIIFGYLSINLTMFNLNTIVPLVILNCSARFSNFLFSLKFLETLP